MGHVPSPAVTRSTGVRLAGGVPAGDRRRLPELPYRVSGWCGDGALAGRPRSPRVERRWVEGSGIAGRVPGRSAGEVRPAVLGGPVRGGFGAFGEPSGRAGPGTSAPDALAVAVGAGMPTEHLLRVPPQQRVHDVGGRHGIRADLAVTDHEVLPAGSPLTFTCKSNARQLRVSVNGQSVRPRMIVMPRAEGGIAPRQSALGRA